MHCVCVYSVREIAKRVEIIRLLRRLNIRFVFFFGIAIFIALTVIVLRQEPAKVLEPNLHLPSLTFVPETISTECKLKHAKLYDPCVDQKILFKKATALAKLENKVLLVSYGADWCIWCHVFKEYVSGNSKQFTYTYGEPGEPGKWTSTLLEEVEINPHKEVAALTTFVRENFVIFHLESDEGLNSDDVMQTMGAFEYEVEWVPFVFSVNAEGRIAAVLDYEAVQIRRDNPLNWYRGYDRNKLLSHLKELHAAAHINNK